MRQWKRNGPLALALGCAAVLAFSGLGFAQADAAEQASDQAAKIIALEKKFTEQMAAFQEAYRAAETDEDRRVLNGDRPNYADFADEFITIAKEDPASDAGFDASVWVLSRARYTPAAGEAVKILMKHHADREGLERVCQSLAYSQSDDAQTLMEYLSDKSPHRNVRGQATFCLAQNIVNRSRGDEEQQAKAEKLFVRVVEQYGDLTSRGGTLADAANGSLFEIRNLAIGKVAPEVEGQDVDGVDFKLTDYRGKVVVIDFWGDW